MGPRGKTTSHYQTLLTNLEIVIKNLNTTLTAVMNLQQKLKTVSEEIKASNSKAAAEVNLNELSNSENQEEIAEAKQVNLLMKDLGEALGLSWSGIEQAGVAESTLSAVQTRFEMAVKALTETLRIMDHVQSVIKSAMKEGKTDDNIKELVSSAMQQAIQATQHSQLALELTAKALESAGSNQKSELLNLLSIIIKDYETQTEGSGKEANKDAVEKQDDEEVQEQDKGESESKTEDQKTMEKLSEIVTDSTDGTTTGGGDSGQGMNATVIKTAVNTALNITSKTKQNAVSEAKAAVENADPKIAEKAGQIVTEITTVTSTCSHSFSLFLLLGKSG